MINLYLDFDGVLVDTINETYKMLEKLGINIKDTEKVNKFYRELDWSSVLSNTKEINDSFKNIELLEKSDICNICILTTVHSCDEMRAKVSYIRSKNKNINIICVPKGVEKCEIVDPKNSILIDDYSGNLKTWVENGGIGIKFSNKSSGEYFTIDSLDKLINDFPFQCSNNDITLKKHLKIHT